METWSKRRDRRKKIQLPMFPGYVFVHALMDSYVHLTVVKTPGALSLLHDSRGPLSIPSYQIENLRTMIGSIQPIEIHPYLKRGEWVHVVRGPLAGCIGILVRIDPQKGRLIVSVDIIKKSVSVELDLEDVEPTIAPTCV
jgi:transcription antitermination factor NusG